MRTLSTPSSCAGRSCLPGSGSGRVALVTGASGEIGAEVASQLLAHGVCVALHYRSYRERLDIITEGHESDSYCEIQADLDHASGAKDLFDSVISWRERLDIVVNCAATVRGVPSLEMVDDALLLESFRVNCVAPFLLAKWACGPMRLHGWGRIVNVSSIGVKFAGTPQTAHYMISKAALEAATLALAKAVAPDGILVNAVRAGVTRTSVHQRLGRDLRAREELIPMKRAAEPSEIARVVLFLVSSMNTYLTGAVIPVAGGE